MVKEKFISDFEKSYEYERDVRDEVMLDIEFHQIRVRIHGRMARIEIKPEEFGMLMADETRNRIIEEFRA